MNNYNDRPVASFFSLSSSQTPGSSWYHFDFDTPGLLYSILSDKKKTQRATESFICQFLASMHARTKKKKYVGATLQRENRNALEKCNTAALPGLSMYLSAIN